MKDSAVMLMACFLLVILNLQCIKWVTVQKCNHIHTEINISNIPRCWTQIAT